jgi:hypothetical protein
LRDSKNNPGATSQPPEPEPTNYEEWAEERAQEENETQLDRWEWRPS